MRIGVFGDVHGNLPALQAVLSDGAAQSVTAWVCLGDVAFRGPQPAQCIEVIAGLRGVVQVVGNTDEWLFRGFPATLTPPAGRIHQLEAWRQWTLEQLSARSLEILRQAPLNHSLQLGSEEVLFTHSSPTSTEAWLPSRLPDESLASLVSHPAQIVVCGHTHQPFVRGIQGRVAINAGSAGHPTDGDYRASYLVLESKDGVTAYQLRRVTYPWQETASLARALGMPMAEEYAKALETGSAL